MKKRELSPKFVAYLRKRQLKLLKVRSLKKKASKYRRMHSARFTYTPITPSPTHRPGGYSEKQKEVVLPTPSRLSLKDNADETIKFFHSLDVILNNRASLHLDMRNVESITTDAILYLLSRFDYHRTHSTAYKVRGNFPLNTDAKNLLIESGFTKYVTTAQKHKYITSNVLAVESGIKVKPQIVKSMLEFTRRKLVKVNKFKTSKTYSTMIECMGNTKNHAYSSNSYGKWWVIASCNADQTIHFVFLDNGLGIPTTVRQKFLEQMPFVNPSDAKIIVSAMRGEDRSQTKFSYRGKGLPSIYSQVRTLMIRNLRIISNTGYVFADNNTLTQESLTNRFHGTLLSWDICEDELISIE